MTNKSITCPDCNSTEVIKHGFIISHNQDNKQRYLCRICARTFIAVGDYRSSVKVRIMSRTKKGIVDASK